jgi:hypothetical protein
MSNFWQYFCSSKLKGKQIKQQYLAAIFFFLGRFKKIPPKFGEPIRPWLRLTTPSTHQEAKIGRTSRASPNQIVKKITRSLKLTQPIKKKTKHANQKILKA